MIVVLALIGSGFAGLGALWRLVTAPTLAARIAALDVVLMALMGGIAVHAAATDRREWLDLLVVIAIVGFTATVAASRFIEKEVDVV